jgi:O-antigen/teichoic acid export membrane protein
MNPNVLINLTGRFGAALLTYLAVPVYIKILGVEKYGVVGLYTVFQSVIALADFGFSSSLSRRLAILSTSTYLSSNRKSVVKTFELAYLLAIAIPTILLALFAPTFLGKIHSIEAIGTENIARTITLLALSVMLQIHGVLYVSALLGLQAQLLANSIQLLFGVLKPVSAIICAKFIDTELTTFFLGQIVSSLIFISIGRLSIRKLLSSQKSPGKIDLGELKSTSNFSIGMFAISSTSLIISQADKIAVATNSALSGLGVYAVCSLLAGIPTIVAQTVSTAMLPEASRAFNSFDFNSAFKLYNHAVKIATCLTVPPCVIIAMNPRPILYIWTESLQVADNGQYCLTILIVSGLIYSFQVIPFGLLLAVGSVKKIAALGIAGAILYTPLIFVLSKAFGILGTSSAWLCYTVISTPILVRTIHRVAFAEWELPYNPIAQYFPSSIILGLIAGALLKLLLPYFEVRWLSLALVLAISLASALVSAFLLGAWRYKFTDR